MVEAAHFAGQASPVLGAALAHQRPRGRPGRPDLRASNRRQEYRGLAHDRLDMVGGDTQIVRIVGRPRACSEHGHLALRQDNVAVPRSVQPADDHVAVAAAHGNHDAGGWRDRDGDARQRRHFPRPRPRGVDHDIRADLIVAPGGVISNRRSPDRPPGHRHARHLGEGPNLRTVAAGRGEEPQGHPHRVHGGVRHLHSQAQIGVEAGLQAKSMGAVDPAGRDGALPASLQELLLVGGVLVGQGHEQAVVLLERSRGDAPQDLVLGDALNGGGAVCRRVAGAAVEQAVVPACRTRGHLAPFNEGHSQTAQHKVVSESSACAAAANDHDVGRVSVCRPSGWFPVRLTGRLRRRLQGGLGCPRRRPVGRQGLGRRRLGSCRCARRIGLRLLGG